MLRARSRVLDYVLPLEHSRNALLGRAGDRRARDGLDRPRGHRESSEASGQARGEALHRRLRQDSLPKAISAPFVTCFWLSIDFFRARAIALWGAHLQRRAHQPQRQRKAGAGQPAGAVDHARPQNRRAARKLRQRGSLGLALAHEVAPDGGGGAGGSGESGTGSQQPMVAVRWSREGWV